MSEKPGINTSDALLDMQITSSERRASLEVEGGRWDERPCELGFTLPKSPPRVSPNWCPDLDEEIRNRRKLVSQRMGVTANGIKDSGMEEELMRSDFLDAMIKTMGAIALFLLGAGAMAAWMIFHGN